MSDNNNSETDPIRKTSAVPLRKETVRVTLKAPGAKPGGAPAGVEAGGASSPAASVPTPLVSSPTAPLTAPLTQPQTAKLTPPSASNISPPPSSNLDLPDVTSAVPLKQETMRVTLKADGDGPPAAPAPTIPLGGAVKYPSSVTPAPTMKLGGAPTVPLATQPLGAATVPLAGASQPLPKATVQLQQTQQLSQGLGGASQVASIHTAADDDAHRGGSGAVLTLSILAFAASLLVLWFQGSHSNIWLEKQGKDLKAIFEAVED